ncbi:hypothetical protein DFS33DRAFT_1277206 [Desarmillaria ectypa]|nr:hypothetical protein DFS33DRAFT_1277206 [Desarmillaria ectypa]
MRFSVAALIPLAALVAPALCGTVNARQAGKQGKYTPIDTKKCDKDTFEIDCKKFCVDHDKCNSCQVYSLEEAAEEFICEIFEEIIDILTWEDGCDKDYKDGKKYYDSSCWNAHY